MIKTEINYDIYAPKETAAPKDVFFYLGVCHHRLGNLDKAVNYFNQFIAESQKGSTLLPLASIRLSQLNAAKKSIQNKLHLENFTDRNTGDIK